MSENSISTVETGSDALIKLAGRLLVATVWLNTILIGKQEQNNLTSIVPGPSDCLP